jgi:hypothetical protein
MCWPGTHEEIETGSHVGLVAHGQVEAPDDDRRSGADEGRVPGLEPEATDKLPVQSQHRAVVTKTRLDVRTEPDLMDQGTALPVRADIELIRIRAHPGTHAETSLSFRASRNQERGKEDNEKGTNTEDTSVSQWNVHTSNLQLTRGHSKRRDGGVE